MVTVYRTPTEEGMITVRLVSSSTRLDLTKKENMLLFVSSEAVVSKILKLETSRTVILPPMVSVLFSMVLNVPSIKILKILQPML